MSLISFGFGVSAVVLDEHEDGTKHYGFAVYGGLLSIIAAALGLAAAAKLPAPTATKTTAARVVKLYRIVSLQLQGP